MLTMMIVDEKCIQFCFWSIYAVDHAMMVDNAIGNKGSAALARALGSMSRLVSLNLRSE